MPTNNWDGDADDQDSNTETNWTLDRVPQAGDNVTIDPPDEAPNTTATWSCSTLTLVGIDFQTLGSVSGLVTFGVGAANVQLNNAGSFAGTCENLTLDNFAGTVAISTQVTR